MNEFVADTGDEVLHTQQCELLVRKKGKAAPKGVRSVVVGRFGLYVFNGKKVGQARRDFLASPLTLDKRRRRRRECRFKRSTA